MSKDKVQAALQVFAREVKEKMSQLIHGDPEDQLRAPFENFLRNVADAFGWKIICIGETPLPNRLGRPDYAVYLNKLLVGYIELKAPGVGADDARFKGRNRDQFKRFSAVPNILYTDGNEWALYRNGHRMGKLIRLSGAITVDGEKAVDSEDAHAVEHLLRDFLSWEPILPFDRRGRIKLKDFAKLLAPLCRMLRENVEEALKDPGSPLVQLAEEWRQLLFPDADDKRFADAYAQTVTFALLLGRSEGAEPLSVKTAVEALDVSHSLLSRALEILTDRRIREEIEAPLSLLERVIGAVPPQRFLAQEDPWLYFYEDFLAVYDPKLRKDAGIYYTPVEVVQAQVQLIEDFLRNHLHKDLGFADPEVVILDPAAGTGTYLLGVIKKAMERVKGPQGEGAIPGKASELAKRLYGFEIMVGPYAVAELRVSRALKDYGANLPKDGAQIYLTDTLEDPETHPKQLPFYYQPIAEQHKKALEVKKKVPVIVCLGNPPYDRHEAADLENKARTGGWVRWGPDGKGTKAILEDFVQPAREAGFGVHLKNLYNLYVYFWRWALWKVFEHETAKGPGIVSFITASSYLDGDAFVGMRAHMRRLCDEIYILDLGGEGRGTRKDENVFNNVHTPVAIAIAFRKGKGNPNTPARVLYHRIEGSRKEKLKKLKGIKGLSDLDWQPCPNEWQAPFRPVQKSAYFRWPLLTDLMPWQHSGVQCKRTWVIAPDPEVLKQRWRRLLKEDDPKEKARLFKETPGRKVTSFLNLPPETPPPSIIRYAFRSFDRQWLLADTRLISRPRPPLWWTLSERQIFLSSLLTKPLGKGPALTVCAYIPDLDHFSGRGAKDILPLYRDPSATEPNLLPGLLELLSETYGREVTPEDFIAYLYGVLAHPAFAERFWRELESREIRVPITKDAKLFEEARELGAYLLWLHTYGERFVPEGESRGHIPPGKARCIKPVPGDPENYPESFEYNDHTKTLRVGKGEFAPVEPEVYEFEVSGLKVVQSWLKYRMKEGAGKKSSPLDDIRPKRWTSQFTTELLELLWVLEATIEKYPDQRRLLEAVIAGEYFREDELPPVPEHMRKAPKVKTTSETPPLDLKNTQG
ncbi:MAG: N-6 DNA methylase [Candidatus Verstraetearchaeota archaeon]|nr:N-6 DNA methylase [Candidatus Verstraetearchaeota archaeon]